MSCFLSYSSADIIGIMLDDSPPPELLRGWRDRAPDARQRAQAVRGVAARRAAAGRAAGVAAAVHEVNGQQNLLHASATPARLRRHLRPQLVRQLLAPPARDLRSRRAPGPAGRAAALRDRARPLS